jgi:hypothetical protein
MKGPTMNPAKSLRRTLLVSLLVTIAACASVGGGAGGSSGGDPNTLTAAEISSAKAGETTIYEAIQRLRPQYFRTRGRLGSDPGGDVSVSVDGGPLSTIDALREVPATTVKEVRYLSANDAAQRFGVRAYSGPVILVTQR